jgi:hypothetical protein
MFGTNYIFILHSFKSVYDILHRFCLFILHSCSMWLSSLHCILTSRPHIGLARFCGCIHWSTWNSSFWCRKFDCRWCWHFGWWPRHLQLFYGTQPWPWPIWWAHSPVVIGRHELQYPSWLPQAAPSWRQCRRWSLINIRLPWPHQVMCLPSHDVVLPQTHALRGGVCSAVSGGDTEMDYVQQ